MSTTSTQGRRLVRGDPTRLGAHWDGDAIHFAVYSEHAEQLGLCLFDERDRQVACLPFPEQTDHVWHGALPGAGPGLRYGLRAHGRWQPDQGLYFDPAQLLVDPYARALSGEFVPAQPRRGRDSAHRIPKGIVVDGLPAPRPARPRGRPLRESIIYEANVRGLTQLHPQVPPALRGSYLGIADPALIDHLKDLGVNTLELLPVHAFATEAHLRRAGLSNYWGYNTLNFFAPHTRYALGGGEQARFEFREMVRALHAANIEVLLDVVYNHTAEGDHQGPIISFRGLDNPTYYRLENASKARFVNDTGCGNTLNTSHPAVRRLILDSLRYWIEVFEVDGFRLDLATTLARETDGFSASHPLLAAIDADPVLRRAKFIAEPWDIGPGGYQLGAFPLRWAEWNDRFRDGVRTFWRGDPGTHGELGRRVHGSSELFEASGRGPWASLNFITAHDGFSLEDLVSYTERHNAANGEDNRDGHSANYSDNLGEEGDSFDAAVCAARERRKRALLATLLLSQGTPMLLAGDEVANSQRGNNNAYCQDNEIGWVQWQHLADERSLVPLIRRLTDLRRKLPMFAMDTFTHTPWDTRAPTDTGVAWLRPDGTTMSEADWTSDAPRSFALVWGTGAGATLLAFNPTVQTVPFELPRTVYRWQCVFDSAQADGNPAALGIDGSRITLAGQTLAAFSLHAESETDHVQS